MVPFETTPTQTQAQTQNDQRYITDSCTQQRVGVGHEMVDSQEARSAELAITSAYPTNASGIIVLLKTPTKSR